jgi:hypothetical protein
MPASGRVRRVLVANHWGGVVIMAWFWLNIPLALFFFCCWAGIPLWLTLTRWHRETSGKHAEIAAMAIPARVITQAPAVAGETSGAAYAAAADLAGR